MFASATFTGLADVRNWVVSGTSALLTQVLMSGQSAIGPIPLIQNDNAMYVKSVPELGLLIGDSTQIDTC